MESIEVGLAAGVGALLAIALAAMLSRRVGVAAPLVLLAIGALAGLLPFVPPVRADPEWILAVVLPPLLYSAAVSMPALEFRREFGAIGGLSVGLVLISSVTLGIVFAALIPGLSLAWGIALGAIMSPTDAVATSIVKNVGVSPRVVAILEGEGLLNDATALVLLRAAVAAAATSWSVGGLLRDFFFAAAVAVLVGYLVGRLNLWLRARTEEAPVNTAISLVVPFAASMPAELLGASGLVAAVVAGLVTGHGAPRLLSPQHRLSDAEVWRTVEVVLEGGIFLLMGLELYAMVTEVRADGHSIGRALAVAAIALAVLLAVRAAYVAPLLLWLRRRARRGARVRRWVQQRNLHSTDPEEVAASLADLKRRRPRRARLLQVEPEAVERFSERLRRRMADIDYLIAEPLGPREGAVVVWAGIRGAVTLAAAQTLPQDTPERSLLVFLAFAVAATSLLVQGGSLRAFVAWVRPAGIDEQAMARERAEVAQVLAGVVAQAQDDAAELPVEVLEAQRTALLELSREGRFASTTLREAMAAVDADQIRWELRRRPVED